MTKWMKNFLNGIGSTIDLWPAGVKAVSVQDPEERLRRPWERTGQALKRAMDQLEREPASQ